MDKQFNNPSLKEQERLMCETFSNIHRPINQFDTSKIITSVRAKQTEGGEETRLLTSERDIEIQIDVGITDTTEDGERVVQFMENDVMSTPQKIYSRCPINFLEFMSKYFKKYGRFPKINVNVNTYDSADADDPEIISSVQGNLTTVYKIGSRVAETISKQIKTGMTSESPSFDVEMDNTYKKAKSGADCVFTCDYIDAKIGGTNFNGFPVILPDDTGSGTIVEGHDFYNCSYEETYYWGIEGSPQKSTFSEWKESSHCFGTISFETEGEGEDTYLKKITFTKKGGLQPATVFETAIFVFQGFAPGATKPEHLAAVNGMMSEVYNRRLGEDDTAEDDDTYTEIENCLRFKFGFNIIGGTTGKLMSISLFNKNIPLAESNGAWAIGTQTITNLGEDRESFYNEYMYFDPALRLPEIAE